MSVDGLLGHIGYTPLYQMELPTPYDGAQQAEGLTHWAWCWEDGTIYTYREGELVSIKEYDEETGLLKG